MTKNEAIRNLRMILKSSQYHDSRDAQATIEYAIKLIKEKGVDKDEVKH